MNVPFTLAVDQTLDRREAILVRMLELGGSLSGIASAHRNHGPNETGTFGVPRPTFLLYDGDTRLTQEVRVHKRPNMPPTIWMMDPEIIVLLPNRDNIDNLFLDGQSAPVGPELSAWIALVNSTITNDPQLVDLVTTQGDFYLSSVETDMKVGRNVGAFGAWLLMRYQFYYPLFPPR